MQCPKEKGQVNYDLQVEFAYTNRAIRPCKLKDIQYNDQQNKDKQQSTKHYTEN